jgi:hypothetical protein
VHIAAVGEPEDLAVRWRKFSRSIVPLEMIAPGTSSAEALVRYVRTVPRADHGFVTVVIPETFRSPSLLAALREPTFGLKVRLLSEPGVVVTDVPVFAAEGSSEPARLVVPRRRVALVLIAGVNDATVQALNYARSLNPDDLRAVYFAFEPYEIEPVWQEWIDRRFDVVLDLVEAPFRDLGPVVLEEVRRVTDRAGAIANVVIPELVVARHRHEFLHNQRALFIKRLLLFESDVVLTSVPYRLGGARVRGERRDQARRMQAARPRAIDPDSAPQLPNISAMDVRWMGVRGSTAWMRW